MGPRKRVIQKSVNNVEEKVVKRSTHRIISVNPSITTIRRSKASTSSTAPTTRKKVIAHLKTDSPTAGKNSKSRIVTTSNLTKNEIKVTLANEVVQAHFKRSPLFGENKLKSMNGETVNILNVKSATHAATNTDVVKDHFAKKTVVSKNQPAKSNIKRRYVPKKNRDEKAAGVKKITSLPISTIGSDDVTVVEYLPTGSAFEATPEPKRKRGRPKTVRKQNTESPLTLDAVSGKNEAVQQCVTPKLKNNDINHKTKTKAAQSCGINKTHRSKARRNIGNAMEDDSRVIKVPRNTKEDDSRVTKVPRNAKEDDSSVTKVPGNAKEYDSRVTKVPGNAKEDDSRVTKVAGNAKEYDYRVTKVLGNAKVDGSRVTKVPDPSSNEHLQQQATTLNENKCVDVRNIIPGRMVFRKQSSSSECMSWIRNISSSSTTSVTVFPKEYICFDNKYPLIKLADIGNKLNRDSINSIKGERLTDNESTDRCSHVEGDTFSIFQSRSRSSSLSSSSSSCSDSDSNISVPESIMIVKDKISEALDKLSSNLKKFDTEIMNWIGYNQDEHNRKESFNDRLYKVLKEEGEVIQHCQNIKRILLDDDFNFSDVDQTRESFEKHEETEYFAKPATVERKYDKASNKTETTSNPVSENAKREKEAELDSLDFVSHEDKCNDDDDALSLYAESISGFESYKNNSTVTCAPNTDNEDSNEYVPRPVNKNGIKPSQTITYMPTKITEEQKHEGAEGQVQSTISVYEERIELNERYQRTKAVCEKQNADSTSINKEPQDSERFFKSSDQSTNVIEKTYAQSGSIREGCKSPTLMSSIWRRTNGVKSVVLGGVCFFNLILKCTKPRCRFAHSQLDIDVIKSRITKLDEQSFIKEYMLIRSWPILRRKYSLLFVIEAIDRKLTRISIEMALDFITKTNPNLKEEVRLKVEVLELVLLYLNCVDITSYADLLSFKIKNEEHTCDIFMQTIAETQNFSRFKQIFINLTNFIYQIPRQFSLDVATSLLERVCILPFEEQLAVALLKILRNTSSNILQNSMICNFEEMLLSENKELFDQLQELKNQILLNNSLFTMTSETLEKTKSTAFGELEKRCSPDTTNLDHSCKTYVDPGVSHVIDSNRTCSFVTTRNLINNSASSPSLSLIHEDAQGKRGPIWNNKTILNQRIVVSNSNPAAPMTMHKGRPNFKCYLKRHHGKSPSIYKRLFGKQFS